MKFVFKNIALRKVTANSLAVFMFENEALDEGVKNFDGQTGKSIQKAMKLKDFTGKTNNVLILPGIDSVKIDRIILVGLGERKKVSAETVRRSVSAAVNVVKNFSSKKTAFYFPSINKIGPDDFGQAVVESTLLSLYEFNRYKQKEKSGKIGPQECVIISDQKDMNKIKDGGTTGEKIAKAVILARDLANEPANVVTPATLADEAVKMSKKNGIKYKIMEQKDMKRLGMGALLGVAKGSDEPAKFIILEYQPKPKVKSQKLKIRTVVLVGKGLTFDSGGISIKPSQSMDEMKYDMSGGATVIGAMQAAAQLNLPVNLIGLIPSTENLPSGSAQRPGDIVRASNGKTIEVLNTDAEGRLILADSLVYAKKYKPDAVIDFATLTGAIVVAIGEHASGLFSNNDELKNTLQKAGEDTGERLWPMPLYEEYFDQIKGDLADIKNIGGKEGGASTAAKFLEQFTDYPWAHLDIAGTAWTTKSKPYRPKGATGVGVRLIIEFLKEWK